MQKFILLLEREENIVVKRGKCWLPAFSSFPNNVVKSLSISGSLKIRIIVWLTHSHTMTPFDAPGKHAF